MSRVQLALNVTDLDAAVDFYAKLFATAPAKRHEGYANFAIESPPLKLVLIENPDATDRLNHLGVEVASTDEVAATALHMRDKGLPTAVEDEVTCCYAVQDKVWIDDPDGAPWEVYVVLADSDTPAGQLRTVEGCGPGACASEPIDNNSVAGCY